MSRGRWRGPYKDDPDDEVILDSGRRGLEYSPNRECEWPNCHERDSVRPVSAEQGANPVAVCDLHRKNVLAVSS